MNSTTHPANTQSLVFHGGKRVELIDWPISAEPLKANEISGRTLASLVSPGTELNSIFDAALTKPALSGYAAVMEIDAVGSAVTTLKPGDRTFIMGPHRARQRGLASGAIPIPQNLSPEVAVFIRLMGVTWTTLTTTRARPADRVIVYGLGIIGNLAAQIFAAAGYRVTAIDLNAARCELARSLGLTDVRQSLTPADTGVHGHAALAIDCTGHEQAVIDACHAVKKAAKSSSPACRGSSARPPPRSTWPTWFFIVTSRCEVVGSGACRCPTRILRSARCDRISSPPQDGWRTDGSGRRDLQLSCHRRKRTKCTSSS